MRRLLVLLVCFLLVVVPVAAQIINPDYAIRAVNSAFESDNTTLRLDFTVTYTGSETVPPLVVTVVSVNTGSELVEESIDSLSPNSPREMTLRIPANTLQSGSQPLAITLRDTEGRTLAVARISVNVPVQPGGAASPAPDANGADSPGDPGRNPLVLRLFGFTIDLADPTNLLALGGIALALLLLLLVLFLGLRMLFRGGKASFTPWQPPYASSPLLNPNSQAARQQGWQLHAQNDQAPPAPTSDGATHIRKLLTGLDGKNLENWHITALRINQYDQYGRVARSQFVASGGLVRRLDRAARSSEGDTLEATIRKIRPISKTLVKALGRRINPRSAMLPVAVDLRLQGIHGEVRILFELFTAQGGQWQLLDRWEPDMIVVSKAIEESFTYSLYGMRPGETYKTYLARLQNDLTRTLVEMVNKSPGARAAAKEDTGQQKAQKSPAENKASP